MVITDTNRVICYDQTIYSDTCVEEDECFSLTLIVQGDSSTVSVDLQRSNALIKIVDDDDGMLHPLLCTWTSSLPVIYTLWVMLVDYIHYYNIYT